MYIIKKTGLVKSNSSGAGVLRVYGVSMCVRLSRGENICTSIRMKPGRYNSMRLYLYCAFVSGECGGGGCTAALVLLPTRHHHHHRTQNAYRGVPTYGRFVWGSFSSQKKVVCPFRFSCSKLFYQ